MGGHRERCINRGWFKEELLLSDMSDKEANVRVVDIKLVVLRKRPFFNVFLKFWPEYRVAILTKY